MSQYDKREDILLISPFLFIAVGRPDIAIGLSIGNLIGVTLTKTKTGRKFASDIWHIQDVWDAAGEDLKKNPPPKQKSILEIWRESKP